MGFNTEAFDRMLQIGYPLVTIQNHFSLSQRDFQTAFQEYQARQIRLREQAYENQDQLKEIWIRIMTLIHCLYDHEFMEPTLINRIHKELNDLTTTYAKASIFNGPITMIEYEEPAATVGSIPIKVHKK